MLKVSAESGGGETNLRRPARYWTVPPPVQGIVTPPPFERCRGGGDAIVFDPAFLPAAQREQGQAEVPVGVGVVGVDREGGAEGGFGVVGLAGLLQGCAEVVVGVGIPRVELHR